MKVNNMKIFEADEKFSAKKSQKIDGNFCHEKNVFLNKKIEKCFAHFIKRLEKIVSKYYKNNAMSKKNLGA